ncbi:MAG: NusA-like transcription termination signal-binding factor [Fervidicoccaceae archaeon]
MPNIKLTSRELKYIALFQDLTGATVKDCIIVEEDNSVIFVVKRGEAGIAIGKGGMNVKALRKMLGKDVKIVEDGETAEELVKNSLAPARVKSVKLIETSGKKTLYVVVEPEDRGLAIGKGGRNINKARLLLKRYFDVEDVVII